METIKVGEYIRTPWGNIEKVEKVLNELCERLTEETEFLKGPVELLGINGFGEHGIIFRITAQTEALKHFGIQRIFMREIKITFDIDGGVSSED